MKSSNQLKKKPYCNDIHYFLIAILLLLISLKNYYFFIALGLYLSFLLLKTKYIIPVLVLCMLFTGRFMLFMINIQLEEDKLYSMYILDCDEDTYTGYIGVNKVLIQQYNHEYVPGDVIEVEFYVLGIDDKSYENDFDYKSYLYSKGIRFRLKSTASKLKTHSFSIYSIKFHYLKYLKNNLRDDSYKYVKALVFGDNDLETDVKDSYSALGISHILAISGLHIMLIYKLIAFVLLKLFGYYRSVIPNVLVTLFVVIIGGPSSCVRALLFLILGSINKGSVKYTKLDILSISMIIMLLYNPYLGYQTGFILSFLVSFALIYSNDFIKSNSYLLRSYKSYVYIFFTTFPFVISISNKISILSLLLSPILSIVVTFVLIPISFVLAIIPQLDFYLKYIFTFMNTYLVNLSSLNITIPFKSFDLYTGAIYYLFFVFVLYGIKRSRMFIPSLLSMSCYLVSFYMFRYVNPYAVITYIDCGQGDSTLIEMPYSKTTILVDAFNSYDYLKKEGIPKIDYLILTHSDSDHIGDYEKILKNISVTNIIYSKYDSLIVDYLSSYKNNKVAVDSGYSISNGVNLSFMGPINSYDDINSNSIVFKLNVFNKSLLFTGDMTIREETDLIKKYGKMLDSDVLKVAHHGSDTSSGINFLKYVTPDISIISVGKNNKYNHPNSEVVKRLEKISKVYMTMNTGNIKLYINKSSMRLSTYK